MIFFFIIVVQFFQSVLLKVTSSLPGLTAKPRISVFQPSSITYSASCPIFETYCYLPLQSFLPLTHDCFLVFFSSIFQTCRTVQKIVNTCSPVSSVNSWHFPKPVLVIFEGIKHCRTIKITCVPPFLSSHLSLGFLQNGHYFKFIVIPCVDFIIFKCIYP